jgi:hypothetical protein
LPKESGSKYLTNRIAIDKVEQVDGVSNKFEFD